MLAKLWSIVLVVASTTAPALASPLGKPFNGSYDTTPELSAEMLTKRAVSSPYVFTAFTSKSESNLYVYTSNDGTNFSLLKGPAYTPPSGLIRDPSVILHTEYVHLIFVRREVYRRGFSGKYYISCEFSSAAPPPNIPPDLLKIPPTGAAKTSLSRAVPIFKIGVSLLPFLRQLPISTR
jgi:hypothetical protein